jgi:hypothetical protein
MDISYHDAATILGFHITSTAQASALWRWTLTTARIRTHAQEAYYQDLSLDKRIRYVHDDLWHEFGIWHRYTPTRSMCETAEFHNPMVFMARGYLPRASFNITMEKG